MSNPCKPVPANRQGLVVSLLKPLAVAMLVAGATSASAQSLQALYDTARGYDATYLGAKAQAESAEFRAAQAKALWLPGVSLNGSATRTNSDLPAGMSREATVESLTLNARQSIFNLANNATVTQAEKSLEIARADLAAAEQDLIVRLAQAYFDVLGAQDALASAQASKKAIAEQLASAKRNFEVGTSTITDTREAEARFDLATAQELAADNDLAVKRLVLNQFVGKTGVTPSRLATPVALPPVTPEGIDAWLANADADHPLVRKARLGVEIAQAEVSKAKAGHMPTLDAVASYGNTHNGGSAYAGTGQAGTTKSATIGLQLTVPIFSGFSVQNRISETNSLEQKAEQDLAAARRGIAQGTRSAFYGVQSGLAQVKAFEAAERSTKLALEATQLGYKVGVRVNLDVLNAQTQLYQTQTNLAKARYDVLVGSLKLRQASGQLKPTDVAALEALLAK